MSSRKSEIEAKRLRLQELRKQREEKEQQKKARESLGGVEDIVSRVSLPSGEDPQGIITSVNKKESAPTVLKKSIAIQTDDVDEQTSAVPRKKEVITYNKATQTEYTSDSEEESEMKVTEEIEVPQEEEVPAKPENLAESPPIQVDEATLAQFFQESFQIINRSIEEDKGIVQNYELLRKSAIDEKQLFLEVCRFDIDTNDGVYSMDLSKFFPELVIISTGHDLYIYNTNFNKFEHHFRSSTKILNVQFSDFHSNFIFGTGFNGKVLIWNLETPLNQTYLESAVSLQTHAYPVWCLDQIHENAGVIITASTDGRVLTWNTNILAKPTTQPLEIRMPKKLGLRYDELTPLCMTHQNDDHGFLLIGAEDGNIYRVKRFDNKANSNSDNLIDMIYIGHGGPITGLSASAEWSNILISSSLDWKLFLWGVNEERPLLEIYKSEAILGCQWRPKHPTQFGFIYEDCLEILDLSIDSVIPIVKINTGEALNKFLFDLSGEKVYLATVSGAVFIYELLLDDVKSDLNKFKRTYVRN